MDKFSVIWTVLSLLMLLSDLEGPGNLVSCELETNTRDFKSIPTTVKSFENDTVLLPCHLDNAGIDYRVRWLKDGKVIVDNSDLNVTTPERVRMYLNYSLEVTRVQPRDTGKYICEVIRAEPWSPLRQVHAIEVLYPPSVITIPEIGIIEVKLDDEVDIACKGTGIPTPIINWSHKGEPLELLTHRPRLKFKASSRHLAGHYECMAINGVGEPARASIQVIILHPPEVETITPWVHTDLTLRSQLECHVVASPPATIHWFHNQSPVISNNRIVKHMKGDSNLLLIKHVQAADLGLYTCKAENRIGMAEIRMQLSGVANIAIFKTDISKNHPTQTTFTLIWEVESYSPIIEYNLWFRPYKPKPPQRDGVFIKDNDDTWTKMTIPGEFSEGPMHTASYVLRGLTPSTVYEAIITSRNRFGWSKPSSILHFATDNVVMDELKSTEQTRPVLEDIYNEEYTSKNFSSVYATSEQIHDHISPSQSTRSNAEKVFISSGLFALLLLSNICFTLM
ncbi:igLON family member 5-like [Arctopsyche grandis]|uniref:igLON family member 5-like n=1 Tax=Arctopsyche grandis TaxID=121162 RepID=UPI00406D8807